LQTIRDNSVVDKTTAMIAERPRGAAWLRGEAGH
jgi:hypothetical protein